jgi:hypothetical protein
MRRQRGLVGLMGLAVLAGLGMVAKPAVAAVTTEQSASILVFPKVIADGTRDTIIQITNTSNNVRFAHCFYSTTSSVCVGGVNNNAPCADNNDCAGATPETSGICQIAIDTSSGKFICSERDFDIELTKQQPTHWVVSTGREANIFPARCQGGPTPVVCDPSTTGGSNPDCCDAGFNFSRIPPVVVPFKGELKCIETTSDGSPESGNALKGEATIEEPATGDVSKYNAFGLLGNDNQTGDAILCLGGGVSDQCPRGAEYAACPLSWDLDHPLDGSSDLVLEGNSTVDTSLTVVPCNEDFLNQSAKPIVLVFNIFDEFESRLSASTTLGCWASFNLTDISDNFTSSAFHGSQLGHTTVRASTQTQGGFMAVLEETHTDVTNNVYARAAQNAHSSFAGQSLQEFIMIPPEQVGGQ